MKILAVANQKGGVGKSTLAVHLGYAAVEAGRRVLLVDMDAQASLSLTFAREPGPQALYASELYADAEPAGLPQVLGERLSIIGSDRTALLAVDSAEQVVLKRPAQRLRALASQYDVCIIDTPPSLGIRLIASLVAADYVVTPVSLGLYELAGVPDLMQTIHVVRTQGFNPRLKHLGIVPTKTNNRSKEQREALDALRRQYGKVILATDLPERAAVKQAIARRQPVWQNTKGEGQLTAGREWRAACKSILGAMA